jgi:hypothetical protein
LPMAGSCGGRIAAQPVEEAGVPEAAPIDATSEPPILDAGSEKADGASLTTCDCPGGDFCVLWFGPDAGPTLSSGGNHLPDAGVLWFTCATGSIAAVCDGGPPQLAGYDVYGNHVSWVACVEP